MIHRPFMPPVSLAFMALAAIGLTACVDSNGFAPDCPRVAILADGGDFQRFRGASRDLTDLDVSGRILGVSGKCQRGEAPGTLSTTVAIRARVQRGPAASGRQAEIPYFVAVTEGDRVLTRKSFTRTVTFAPNTDTAIFVTEDLPIDLPITPEKSGAAYSVLVSFQLTPEQLRENRHGK